MDINALLQMLQQRFGKGSGGQQAFGGGTPNFKEGLMHIQPGQQLTDSPSMPSMGGAPQAGASTMPAWGGIGGGGTAGMNLGGTGSGSSPMGGGNVMQSIMQMMQRGRGMGGGMGRQMNLG